MDLLNIRSTDPETQRRGRALAVIILGMITSTITLMIYNAAIGVTMWILSSVIVLAILGGLFFANRYGFVKLSSMFLIFIALVGPFLMFNQRELEANYILMLIPVLITSFTIVSWSGIPVTILILTITAIYFQPMQPPIIAMAGLFIISLIIFLFAESLERINRKIREDSLALAESNEALARTSEEQQTLLDEQEHILKDQQELLAAIQDLSVTVLQVADDVLLCPLVGKLTTARMQAVLSSLLAAVGSYRANRLILDLTGQKNVAQNVVDMLFRLVQAVRLLGCEVVLTGISAQLATQLVQNKNSQGLSDVLTVSSLQQGLELALHQ